MGTYIRGGHTVEPSQYEPGLSLDEQAHAHSQDFFFANAALDVSYAPTQWLSLEARVPIRAVQVFAHFHDEHGETIAGFESIHHRTELLFGAGDPQLGARLSVLSPSPEGHGVTLGVRGGLFVPVGGIEPDPFELARRGRPHQHMFFGTGTFIPSAAVDVAWTSDLLRVGGSLDVAPALYRNRYGYLPPSRLSIATYVDSSFGLRDWTFRFGPEVYVETPAAWTSDAAENSGRIDLTLSSGVFHQVRRDLEVYALVKVTPVTFALGGQLWAPVLLAFGTTADIPLLRGRD